MLLAVLRHAQERRPFVGVTAGQAGRESLGKGLPSVAMSAVVNCFTGRMDILVLNAKESMDTKSSQYADLCKAAVCAIKQVCLGLRGLSHKELAELLRGIARTQVHCCPCLCSGAQAFRWGDLRACWS